MRRISLVPVILMIVLWLAPSAIAYQHPQLGRFMQRDPLEYVDGSNLYMDRADNPVNFLDLTGAAKGADFDWEEITPWFYRATKDGANIKQLSQMIQENDESWQCIWPSTHLDFEKSRRFYPKAQAACGDVYDVSNLLKESGPDLGVVFVQPGSDRDRMAAYTGFQSVVQGPGLATLIRDTAVEGSSPLNSMIVGSHGQIFLTSSIGDGSGRRFNIGSLENVATVKTGQPDFIAAHREKGPPRCWFRPGADVRFLGCKTAQFAETWANSIGRKRHQDGWTTGTIGSFGIDANGTVGWFQKNAIKPDPNAQAAGYPYSKVWDQQQWLKSYRNKW